jgi:hypothetical protein
MFACRQNESRIAALEHETKAELSVLRQELQALGQRQQQQQEQQQAIEPEPEPQPIPERNHANEEVLRQLQDAVRELQTTHDADVQQLAMRLEESTQAYVQLQEHMTAHQVEQQTFREKLGRCDRKGEVLEEQLEALQQQLMKLHQQTLQPRSQPTSPQPTADNQPVEQLQQQVAGLESKVAEHSKQLAEAERKLERASQNRCAAF